MRIETFLSERWLSTWEHQVEYNLAKSSVEPLHLRELLADSAAHEALLDRRLGYPQTNGTPGLRSAISALYPGAGNANLLVTTGCAEANLLVTLCLIERDDEVVMMVPNYMQTRGLARSFGGRVRPWRLRLDQEAGRWRLDLDELRQLMTPRTRLILLCNPNNPTGACLEAAELDEICRIADSCGAWVLSDEIYRGAELEGTETASIWGRSERALVTSSLSKAYGLPGLRIGWIAGSASAIESLWSYHDYTTIAHGALNDYLATKALEPGCRSRLLERTRGILRTNYPVVASWLAEHASTLSYLPPQAGAFLYLRYSQAINSTVFTERLRQEKGVLIVPGDFFGMDGYLRLGYGVETAYMQAGLERVTELLREVEPGI